MAFNHVARARDLVPLRRLLVSAWDKTGLADFVGSLACAMPAGEVLEVWSTGGSYRLLAEAFPESADEGAAGSACRPENHPFFRLRMVEDLTGQPEMKGGLVKTLDWRIYLGLLAEPGDADHEADLERAGALAFDMVVCNLYPFGQAVASGEEDLEALRQRIDIGGPAMTRAAAKNYLRVAAVSDPSQYAALAASVRQRGGATSLAERAALAAAAFARTSAFDATVAARLAAIEPAALAAAYGKA